MTRTRLLLASTALVSAFVLTPAIAADTKWTGTKNDQFNDAANWDGNFAGGDLVIDGDGVVVNTLGNNAVGSDANATNSTGMGPRSVTISGGATLNANANDPAIALGWSPGVTSYITVKGVSETSGNASTLVSSVGPTMVGYQAGAIGILTVDLGAKFTANRDVVLGNSDASQGSLIINNGSSAVVTTNSVTYIGRGDNSTGTLKVLNGSRFEATGNTFLGVGKNSTGTLIVDNGSTFIQGSLGTLGVSAQGAGVSQGSVTISRNSTAILNGAVVVGYKSTSDGLFTVSSGSTATFNSSLMLGQEYGSNGAAVFTGEGTEVNLNGAVTVGLRGAGSMQISDGATVNAARLDVGVNAAPLGDYAWQGPGTGTIIVGGAYDASAANEGALASGALNVTTIAFGDGESKLDFNISDSDTYTFAGAVTGAGDINVYNGTISLTGDYSAYTGDTTVSGGTLLVNTDTFQSSDISLDDNGSLIIDNGSSAVVTTNSVTYIGRGDDSTGTLKVLNGSRFEATGNTFLGVGKNSTGTLIVDNGSTFIQGSLGTLGVSAQGAGVSQGSVTISRNSTAILNGAVVVGYKSTSDGLFTVSGGSTATFNSSLMLGQEYGSNGAAVFTGEDTEVNLNGAVTVGLRGAGSMQISDGATVNAARLDVGVNAAPLGDYAWQGPGTGTIIVGGAYDASAANEGALASGALNVTMIGFGDGESKLDFNISDSDTYTFAGAVTGAGDINVYNGTISLKGDYSAYTGDTTVSGGTLLVNTDTFQSSDISLDDGATLGGTGTLTSVTLTSGAAIAPGSSGIGTLTVSGGDVTFVSGSTLSVRTASDGTSDRLDVTSTGSGGSVTIEDGATLHVSGLSGDPETGYSLASSYTVLTAANNITGTFSSVTDDFVYLDVSADQDTNEIRVQLLRNDKTLGSVVSSGHSNGRAAANALDSLGDTNELYNAALWMTGGDLDRTYQELSGDSYPGTSQAIMGATRYSRDIVASRLRSAFNGVATMEMATVATHGDGTENEVSSSGGPVLWAKGYGAWSKLDGSTGVTGLQSGSAGVVFGGDTEIADAWRAGVFAGYGHTHAQARGIVSENDADTFQFGLYGGRQFGALGFRLGASYSYHDVSADRTVTVAALTSDLSADYSAHTAYGFAELGYLFRFNNTKVEPFANQAIVYQNTDGFTETGGSAALSVRSSDQTHGVSTLGVRFEQDLSSFFHGPFALTGSLAWQHTFGNVDAETTMRYASGGNAFRVTGAPLDRDQAMFSAGFRAKLTDSADFSLSYEGTVGEDSQSHGAQATVAVRF